MASFAPKIPTLQALLNLAIALAILAFVMKTVVPERIRAYFRV